MTLIRGLFILSLFGASFDIFLVFNLGFTFRISQLLLLIPIVAALAVATIRSPRWPLGFRYLCIWALFIVAFVPNTSFPARSIGYAFFLIFSILLVFTAVQLFRTPRHALLLLRWYIASFVFVALFGVFQFVAPLLHLGSPLITEWWIPGLVPRVNGFSYEPSYFTTYLLLGLVVVAHALRHHLDYGITRRWLWLSLGIISFAIALSSSRLGWAMAVLALTPYFLPPLFEALHKLARSLMRGRIARTQIVAVISACALLVISLGLFATYADQIKQVDFLLNGLGLTDEGGIHSVDTRLRDAQDTLRLFGKSPLLGYSLGGIAPAIAQERGVEVQSVEEAKQYEGLCIFAEVLAASGVLGFVPFMFFMREITWRPLRLPRRALDPVWTSSARGLAWALVVELIALQFNQNILRLYLWYHIAVLAAVFQLAHGRRSLAPNLSPASSPLRPITVG